MGRPKKSAAENSKTKVLSKPKFASVKRKKRMFHGNRFSISKCKAMVDPTSSYSEDGASTSAATSSSYIEHHHQQQRQPTLPVPPLLLPPLSSLMPEALPHIETRSFTKLKDYDITVPEKDSGMTGNRILDIGILSNVISLLACPECKQISTMEVNETCKQGLVNRMTVKCVCTWEHSFWTSKRLPSKSRGFDVNCRFTYAMRQCGQGYAGIERFTTLMDMPPPFTQNNYDKIVKKIRNSVKLVAKKSMKDAATEVKSLSKGNPSDNIYDIPVSCDGTWQRRGFSSLNGTVSCISMDTGKVLDVVPMSRYCKRCENISKMADSAEKTELQLNHVCTANFSGSAPSMETEGTKIIFNRSINRHKLRYTELYGDGDTKSFYVVENIYGPNKKVIKRECIGHVQKRVGARLRKLKKETKGLSGRGKLTDAVIDKLQNYYGLAIRSYVGDKDAMKKSIFAGFCHVASNKEKNYHIHCPPGKYSWCGYQRAVADGDVDKFKHGPGLPMNVTLQVRKVFDDLSNDSLLDKCLHGKTQNQNESFNNLIWERLPKTTYVGMTQLALGIYDAVAYFNMGAKTILEIYETLQMVPGYYTTLGCAKRNRKRIRNSIVHSQSKNILRRKKIRGQKKKKDDNKKQIEGKTYKAGSF